METSRVENGRAGSPLPCPRCHSSNTKFCYYNNHNVNQPRHFCRGCQRYWTAGGSLRNVPIGAGKRKHKGPLAAPAKAENLTNIFAFHADQGGFTHSVELSNVSSLKEHAINSHGESKLVEAPCAVPQAPVMPTSEAHYRTAFVSRPLVPAGYDAPNAVAQKNTFECSVSLEKVGLTEFRKQPSFSLGLNLSKEPNLQEDDAKMVSHIDNDPLKTDSSQQTTCEQGSCTEQYNSDRDYSTACSSVTANLGVPTTEPIIAASNIPEVEQSASLLNPFLAFGASMCPPWVWPFVLSGNNVVRPANLPQLDVTLAAATAGAMASIPPIKSGFVTAMEAMASSCRTPQIDPNVMAAVSASLLQFPHLWSPYMWGLPWTMTSAAFNLPNALNKRSASPSLVEGGSLKLAKKGRLQETSNNDGRVFVESKNAQNLLRMDGVFDAYQPMAAVSPPKPVAPLQVGDRLAAHQQRASSHSNPAAQARSAAFQERY